MKQVSKNHIINNLVESFLNLHPGTFPLKLRSIQVIVGKATILLNDTCFNRINLLGHRSMFPNLLNVVFSSQV